MISIKLMNVSAELKRIAQEVKNKADIGRQVYKLKAELAAATPVDTGLAQSSWIVVKNSPYDYAVQNTVEYIDELNAGSSKQAPRYFIEKISLKYGKPVGAIVNLK